VTKAFINHRYSVAEKKHHAINGSAEIHFNHDENQKLIVKNIPSNGGIKKYRWLNKSKIIFSSGKEYLIAFQVEVKSPVKGRRPRQPPNAPNDCELIMLTITRDSPNQNLLKRDLYCIIIRYCVR
jgi:hypothetical protein